MIFTFKFAQQNEDKMLKKRDILSLILSVSLSGYSLMASDILDITQYGYEQYQDIIVDNAVVKKATHNHKDCHTRYQVIQQLLDQYQRPFTLLDIGAAQGYYSLRTAYDYDAVCVMIESNNESYPFNGDQLLDICKANKQLNNIIFLNKLFTPDDLQHLSECEHFDVVLAMNILHRFGDRWREVADAIFNMADHAIVEIPPQETIVSEEQNQLRQEIEDYILAKGGCILGSAPRHTSDTTAHLYLVSSGPKYLQRKTWLLSKNQDNDYIIESSFTEKKLTKPVYWPPKATQTISWIPGINLLTFKMCNGAHPSKEMLKKSLLLLKDEPHTDWTINNMVVQGNQLAWVDKDDSSRGHNAILKPTGFSEERLQAHMELMDLDDPKQIEHCFWHYLIRVPVSKQDRVSFLRYTIPVSSLVFDIHTQSDQLIDIYLGHGAKVICYDSSEQINEDLSKKFALENVIVINNKTLEQYKAKPNLDGIVALYGKPQFCHIHVPANAVYPVLQGLSQAIPYLAFKFEIQSTHRLKECLEHLSLLGYTEFNFSPRDIPLLGLNTNIHIGTQEKWVNADELLQAIQNFAALDHNSSQLWGYVYARY